MKAKEIAEFLDAELYGNGDLEILRAAALNTAAEGDLAFVDRVSDEWNTNASCVLIPNDPTGDLLVTSIKVTDPKLAFAKVAALLHPAKSRPGQVHPSAVISASAALGTDVFIGAFCCIGDNSHIGDGTQLRAGAKIGDNVRVGSKCILHPNVFIEDGCSLGKNVVLHAGVVIGADGFGYVRDKESYIKFPQIGTVIVGDDVEIGANSCVDRGALGETRIGQGTKIDNLVQIAHNVQIGKRVIIAAQTGISGSTVIEDDCVIGGQVGMGDHATVKSGAVIGSQAGILPGKIVRPGIWWGTPVQPLDEYKRQNAHVKGLSRLRDEVKNLKQQIAELIKSGVPKS
jgi:UDP-3-O-[3-hydroxymyristoyl] glucosamine N-acyltransferase